MWHNLITSKIVYDKNGKLQELQTKYQIPYPKKLKENFDENLNKLFEGMFCAKISPIIKDMVDEIKKVISKM